VPSSAGRRPLRVAVLTGPFTATYDAQLSALRERTGATVQIVYQQASAAAPYDDAGFAQLDGAIGWKDDIPVARTTELLDRLRPDVLLVTSWGYGPYVRLARAWRGRALRLMIMDNPWRSTPKQWAGVVISRLYLQPAFDVAFLPNERQRVFARKLGFGEDRIWPGVYCCDQPRFEVDRTGWAEEPPAFLYAGRLVALKGVEVLLRAYAAYRRRVEEPWALHIAGTGPLEAVAAGAEGVVLLGFRQPAAMPAVFAGAGCFVLPSLVEPWGIVLHEAAASGLPLLCTTSCGASLDLVRDGYNGFTIPPGSAEALAEAMVRIATMDADRRRAMGRASVSLSRQLTPARWADDLDEKARSWLERSGLGAQGADPR
jgi:glycosyltransferase involved in cell wall biosynthesis